MKSDQNSDKGGVLKKLLAGAVLVICATSCVKVITTPAPDPRSILLLNQEAMASLSSYQAECSTTSTMVKAGKKSKRAMYEWSRLVAEKPNKMRYDGWHAKRPFTLGTNGLPTDTAGVTVACDGKQEFEQFGKTYRTSSYIQPDDMVTGLEPWIGFYSKKDSVSGRSGTKAALVYGGTAAVDGVDCDKVLIHQNASWAGTTQHHHITYFIGRNDHLIREEIDDVIFETNDARLSKMLGGKTELVMDAHLKNIVTNAPVDPTLYTYKIPAGVTLEKKVARKDPPLLPNGSLAPDFTATDMNKKPVKLSDFRGKVVLVDFWASWCGPCNASMPHTQELMKEMAATSFTIVPLLVDDGEDRAGFESWVSSNQAKYPNLRFVYSDMAKGLSGKTYRVSGIPTQYVLDRQGKIQASFVGFNPYSSDLKNALLKAHSKQVGAKPVKG